ncbi:ureidoglycolate lyase [Pseudorhizobium pelagicum]|uniref:ureidoglycolate lyase n=1 Tax=Pseudorhizobium pelagicum TaxID=1509405 RepID=UPI003D6B1FFF
MLWVVYRSSDTHVTRLENHSLTQQAIVPLTGPIIQIVGLSSADGSPDTGSLKAFKVLPGQGICMRVGCWHATRVEQDPVTCAMLSRRSTTLDLAEHLNKGTDLSESAYHSVSLLLT